MNIIPSAQDADEKPAMAGFAPIALNPRRDGWTPARQRAFIEELADCGVVREAAGRVGMTEQSARRLRRRPGAESFAFAWDCALIEGGQRLRSIAFERAVHGTTRQHYYHGKLVGEEKVFDNRLLTYLLARTSSLMVPDARKWNQYLAQLPPRPPEALPTRGGPEELPVWRDEQGDWLTRFPPPEDFHGQQWGGYGDEDYARRLGAEESAAILAWESRQQEMEGAYRETESVRRDRFFNSL